MLNDAVGFEKIFIATGYTDLRRGIDGLASTIKFQFDLDPFQKHILFLFCGKRTDRIKGLVWEGDGFLLLYKRLNIGGFSWPRTKEEAMEITSEQIFYFCTFKKGYILLKKIVIHNQNLMETILVIKDTFDASCQREKVSTVI